MRGRDLQKHNNAGGAIKMAETHPKNVESRVHERAPKPNPVATMQQQGSLEQAWRQGGRQRVPRIHLPAHQHSPIGRHCRGARYGSVESQPPIWAWGRQNKYQGQQQRQLHSLSLSHLCTWPRRLCCPRSCRPPARLPPHPRRWAGSPTASARRPPAHRVGAHRQLVSIACDCCCARKCHSSLCRALVEVSADSARPLCAPLPRRPLPPPQPLHLRAAPRGAA